MRLDFRLIDRHKILTSIVILSVGFGIFVPFVFAQSPTHTDGFLGDVEEIDNPTISWRAPLF